MGRFIGLVFLSYLVAVTASHVWLALAATVISSTHKGIIVADGTSCNIQYGSTIYAGVTAS